MGDGRRENRLLMLDVVYDGLCRFCVRSLSAVQMLDSRHVLRLHDANDRVAVAERFPTLRNVDLDAAMYVVDGSGRSYAGFYAFRRIARALPLAWPLLPLLHLPGASAVGTRIYALVARNRRRLGCRV
jgi:predicted DCC family thiol-disulfide oxidoreductase YuxK